MHARRLFRLVVAPSTLFYLALGFLGGLIWLTFTAARSPALQDAAPALAAPPGGRVSLQNAIDSVRRFAGAPDLVLEGGLASAGDDRRGELYHLETASPVRGQDFFKVDVRTGEVVEATFRSRLAPADPANDLTVTEAQALAARFARAHFWGFEQLQLVDRSLRTGESGTIHSFKWSQIAPESGAELPVSVSVAVSGRSGKVFWYLAQRDPLTIDPLPAVTREQAIETARSWLLPRDTRWSLDEPSVRLQVLYDDDDRQQLVWSIVFAGREAAPRASLRLLVDAHTGELIQSAA